MAREIRKDKLFIAVKKTSGPLQCRINKYLERLDALERGYGNSAKRMDAEAGKKLAAILERKGTVREILAVAGEFGREKQDASSIERTKLRRFSKSKMEEILNSGDAMCALAMDKGLHLAFILEFEKRGDVLVDNLLFYPQMDAKAITELGGIHQEVVENAIGIERFFVHSFLACRALEISISSQASSVLEFPHFMNADEILSEEKCAQHIKALSGLPGEDVAKELLKLLHPDKWEAYLIGCLPKQVQVKGEPSKEAQNPAFSKEHAHLSERLLREYPDEEFSGIYIQELGKACGWDIENAICVEELGNYGIDREDALFLVGQGLSAEMVSKHTLMESILSSMGISHREIHHVFMLLSEDQCWELGEKLEKYLGWKKIMPGNWSERDVQETSALLALSIAPPKGREGIHSALENCEDCIMGQLLETDGDVERAESRINDYKDYGEGFVQNEGAASEESEGEEAVPAAREEPYETLEFPPDVEGQIGFRGLSVENVKKTLVRGLRLNSSKAAIGGKYFPLVAFRKNTRGFLRAGELADIEEFLYKEGVISYYKNGDVVKLNLKKSIGQHNAPSVVGREILNSVISWKVEHDKRTKGNGEAQSAT